MPADKRLNDPALAIHASVADDDIFYMVKDPTGAATQGSVAGSVIDSYITSSLSDNYQPLDAGLTSISGLVTAADKMIYTTALDTYAVADLTPFARTLLDDASAAAVKTTLSLENVENTALSTWGGSTNLVALGTVATGTWSATDIAVTAGGTGASTAADARTNLGLAIGTDVQAYDAELAALAGLTSAADKLPYFTGSGTATVTDLTSFARTLLDDTTQGAMQTTLDVDPSGTDNSTDVTLAGSLDYLTLSGQQITRNAIDLTTDITGELPVANGGTGVTSDINTGGVLSNVAYLGQANTFSVGPQTIEGANGLDINPGSDIDADLITVGVTGTPRIYWDESANSITINGDFTLAANAAVFDITGADGSGDIGLRLIYGSTTQCQWSIQDSFNVTRLRSFASGGFSFGNNVSSDVIFMKNINTRVGLSITNPAAQLDVYQSSATGAIPVLKLKQTDISEQMMELDGTTIGTGNAIEAIGAKTLTTTHFVKVTITGVGTRYFPVGTIA